MRFLVECDPRPFPDIETAASAEEQVEWTDGESAAAWACTVSFAALEIVSHLERISGVEARATSPGFPASGERVIRLRAGKASAGGESFEIEGEGRRGYTVTGGGRVGVLYGACELLERLGFRWFGPDAWDEETPELSDPLPAVRVASRPSFELRGFLAGADRGHPGFLRWMAHRKLNLWSAATSDTALCRKLGMKLMGGGHGLFAKYLDPAKYFEPHPEFYALMDGHRRCSIPGRYGGDNICMSNPEAVHIFAEALARDLAGGDFRHADLVNVWGVDGGQYCQCAACAELGNPSQQILHLVHHCHAAIRQAHLDRNVKLVVPAYHETLPPPSAPLPEDFNYEDTVVSFFPIERCYAHAFDDPACKEINETLAGWYRAWTREPRWRMLMGEYYNVSSFAGIAAPLHDIIDRDLPLYAATGARHIHYMHVPTAGWGTLALTNGFYAAKAWDTGCDRKTWLADFLTRRYRGQAGRMGEFYDVLQRAMRNCKPLKHYIGIKDPDGRCGMQIRHLHRRNLEARGNPVIFHSRHLAYDADFDGAPSLLTTMRGLERAGALLDDAIYACTDPVVAPRLCLDARRFRYTRNLVRFLHALVRLRTFENSGRAAQAELEARELRDIGEALRAETDMPRHIHAEDGSAVAALYRNGLTATWMPHAYAAVMADYGLETPDTPGGAAPEDRAGGSDFALP